MRSRARIHRSTTWTPISAFALSFGRLDRAQPVAHFIPEYYRYGDVFAWMESELGIKEPTNDGLHDDYVMAAIGKGLPDPVVRDRHVGRNAILPVLSRLVISLPYLLTGAVMIEFAVGWPGIGTNLFFAVGQQDVNVAMGLLVIIGVISLGARLLLDMLVALFDPRIRYVGRSGMV